MPPNRPFETPFDPSDRYNFVRDDRGKVIGQRNAELRIIDRKPLMMGGRGNVSVARVVLEKDGRSREVECVIKKYIQAGEAERAYGNALLLQRIGIKTFKTYRLNRSAGEILMTNLNRDEYVTLARNGPHPSFDVTLEKFGMAPVDRINNLDALIADTFSQALVAARNAVILEAHAYFFITPKTNPVNFEVFVGDLDNIRTYKLEGMGDGDLVKELIEDNIKSAGIALKRLVMDNVVDIYRNDLLAKINEQVEQVLSKSG